MPDAEVVAAELVKAESMDEYLGKDGILAKLSATTLESMMEEELADHLG